MAESLSIALQIALVGMGLVFAAIVLLWALMAALVRLTADHAPEAAEPGTVRAEVSDAFEPDAQAHDHELRRQAAAIAVAAALAHETRAEPKPFPLPPTALVSAWQAVMRASQLTRKGPKP